MSGEISIQFDFSSKISGNFVNNSNIVLHKEKLSVTTPDYIILEMVHVIYVEQKRLLTHDFKL